MNWLVILVLVAVSFKIAAAQDVIPTGSCASINYSDQCCPPLSNCMANDGECTCAATCHRFRDCCSDVACPAAPMSCQEAGINQCCNESIQACEVRHPNENGRYSNVYCSCDASCHHRKDCCHDAVEIGCKPTCSSADKQPGCCRWSLTSSCNVNDGNYTCYCDSYCIVFGDCCVDVQLTECPGSSSTMRNRYNTEVQSRLKQNRLALQYHVPKHPRIPSTYPGYDHHWLAVVARSERVRANAGVPERKEREKAASPPTLARDKYKYNNNY